MTSTTRWGRPPGTGGRAGRSTQGSSGSGAPISGASSHDEQPLDWHVRRAPAVLVGLVAAEEVESRAAGLQGHLDRPGDQEHARRQVASIRVHAGVVEVERLAVVEPDAGRDPATADGQELQRDLAIRAAMLEEAAEEDAALGASGRRREEPVGAPALL